MRDQKESAAPEEQDDEQLRGPRGGNSGRSIPPGADVGNGRDAESGADLSAGYANDEWAIDQDTDERT